MLRPPLLLLLPLALAACEQLGIDDPVKVAEKKEAEGRAVGSGCRHVGMSLQACYEKNKKESKAAILAGWREMDGYMRENNIETIKPTVEEKAATPAEKEAAAEKETAAEKPATAEKSALPGKDSAAPDRAPPLRKT